MEIRKFLISDCPENIRNCNKEEILQGYFDHYKKNIEVKQIISYKNKRKHRTYLTKNNQTKDLIKQNKYQKISEKLFQDYREFAQHNSIHKIKYTLEYKKQTINIYQFLGKLDGLWIAEIEFEDKKQSGNFTPPQRFHLEITNQKESENKFLAIHGMQKLIQKNKFSPILTNFQLKNFYNQEAKKYAQTRKKHRGDAEILLKHIQEYPKDKIKILEIGCGSGRLLEQLNLIKNKEIDYTGVDISENLIQEAEKIQTLSKIKKKFVCQNMLNYLKNSKQESFDIVIGIASFQHLADKKQRHLATKHIYKLLTYEGLFIMTNRSFSSRFLKKHWKSILKNQLSKLLNYKNIDWNSLKIAWKTQDKVYYRFYHIFTLKELKKLLSQAGFVISKLGYLNKKGEETKNRKNSSNSIVVAKKTIFSN